MPRAGPRMQAKPLMLGAFASLGLVLLPPGSRGRRKQPATPA